VNKEPHSLLKKVASEPIGAIATWMGRFLAYDWPGDAPIMPPITYSNPMSYLLEITAELKGKDKTRLAAGATQLLRDILSQGSKSDESLQVIVYLLQFLEANPAEIEADLWNLLNDLRISAQYKGKPNTEQDIHRQLILSQSSQVVPNDVDRYEYAQTLRRDLSDPEYSVATYFNIINVMPREATDSLITVMRTIQGAGKDTSVFLWGLAQCLSTSSNKFAIGILRSLKSSGFGQEYDQFLSFVSQFWPPDRFKSVQNGLDNPVDPMDLLKDLLCKPQELDFESTDIDIAFVQAGHTERRQLLEAYIDFLIDDARQRARLKKLIAYHYGYMTRIVEDVLRRELDTGTAELLNEISKTDKLTP